MGGDKRAPETVIASPRRLLPAQPRPSPFRSDAPRCHPGPRRSRMGRPTQRQGPRPRHRAQGVRNPQQGPAVCGRTRPSRPEPVPQRRPASHRTRRDALPRPCRGRRPGRFHRPPLPHHDPRGRIWRAPPRRGRRATSSPSRPRQTVRAGDRERRRGPRPHRAWFPQDPRRAPHHPPPPHPWPPPSAVTSTTTPAQPRMRRCSLVPKVAPFAPAPGGLASGRQPYAPPASVPYESTICATPPWPCGSQQAPTRNRSPPGPDTPPSPSSSTATATSLKGTNPPCCYVSMRSPRANPYQPVTTPTVPSRGFSAGFHQMRRQRLAARKSLTREKTGGRRGTRTPDICLVRAAL